MRVSQAGRPLFFVRHPFFLRGAPSFCVVASYLYAVSGEYELFLQGRYTLYKYIFVYLLK